MYKFLVGGNEVEEASLFSVITSDRTRGNGHKVKIKKIEILSEHKMTLLTVKVVKH